MNIQIFDNQNVSSVIGTGALPRGSQITIKSAFQIQGWVEGSVVFLGGSAVVADPFGVSGGDCLFDTGSLFCFAGAQNADADNVMMVLWQFQMHPQSGDSGSGQLNTPPAGGALSGGNISWEIV